MVLVGLALLYRRMAKRMCSLKVGGTSPATDRNTARSEALAVATRHLHMWNCHVGSRALGQEVDWQVVKHVVDMQERDAAVAHHLTAEPGMANSALRALPPGMAASTAHVTHVDSRCFLPMPRTAQL